MRFVSLPVEKERPVSFYLAMEEYLARHPQKGEYLFFMWQVQPSVIFGRNQVIEKEVNQTYCQQHGIRIFRRKSGGGCVYADKSNIMLSFITQAGDVSAIFHRYVSRVASVLCALGVPAEATGRNDILIAGRKVSGNAFYRCGDSSIVHGTMLFDTDMQHMVASITPSEEKLVSKGVESVRQHVALLKDYLALSLEAFQHELRQRLCGEDQMVLTPDDIAAIESLEQTYLSPSFIVGANPAYSLVRSQRIEGVGEIELRMEVKSGTIRDISILGDFFLNGDLDESVLKPLRGIPLEAAALTAALPSHLPDIILGLQRDTLVALLLNPVNE